MTTLRFRHHSRYMMNLIPVINCVIDYLENVNIKSSKLTLLFDEAFLIDVMLSFEQSVKS